MKWHKSRQGGRDLAVNALSEFQVADEKSSSGVLRISWAKEMGTPTKHTKCFSKKSVRRGQPETRFRGAGGRSGLPTPCAACSQSATTRDQRRTVGSGRARCGSRTRSDDHRAVRSQYVDIQSHIDYVIEAILRVWERREQIHRSKAYLRGALPPALHGTA
jgi:hypothetical protein